jgi:cellulose biosynthesis protein BcsQ
VRLAVANLKGGTGKCLEGAAEIVDPRTGLLHTIEQVVQDGGVTEVLTLAGRRTITSVPITAKIDSGEQPCVRVTFSSGRSITTTLGHPFLMPDGWRRADELRVGETAALPARLPFPSEPVEVPDAELDLLAILLAEGGCSQRSVRFSTTDPEILERAAAAARALGATVAKVSDRGCDYRISGRAPVEASAGLCGCGCGNPTKPWRVSNAYHGHVRGQPQRYYGRHQAPSIARTLQRRHGLDGRLAKAKTMPPAVYRLPAHQLARFLSVFWMCDGYIGKDGPGMALASESLLRAVQHLLLRFGIQSKVAGFQAGLNGRRFPAWKLTVYAHCWEAFRASIPLWGAKQERLNQLCASAGRNTNVGDPSGSSVLRAQLRQLAPDRRAARSAPSLQQVADRLGWGHFQYDLLFQRRTGTVSRRTLRAFCEVFDYAPVYGWLWSDELFWDRITLIEPAGVQHVYDLMVEPTRCFVANDVVVHNTTSAVYLALGLAARGRTLLVDADPQASALSWSERAGEVGDFPPTVIHWPTRDLARRVGQVADDYTHVVVDTPPNQDAPVRQAILCTDLLLVPLAPSLLEIARLGPTFDAAAEVEALHPVSIRVLLVRVRAGTRSARDARIALEAPPPEGLGLPTLRAEVGLRESYATAYGLLPSDLGEYAAVLAELLAVNRPGGTDRA